MSITSSLDSWIYTASKLTFDDLKNEILNETMAESTLDDGTVAARGSRYQLHEEIVWGTNNGRPLGDIDPARLENMLKFSAPQSEEEKKIIKRVFVKENAENKYSLLGWVLGSEISSCMCCKEQFDVWRWKHHCRASGLVICNSCSTFSVVEELRDQGRVRVCITCKLDPQTNEVSIAQYLPLQGVPVDLYADDANSATTIPGPDFGEAEQEDEELGFGSPSSPCTSHRNLPSSPGISPEKTLVRNSYSSLESANSSSFFSIKGGSIKLNPTELTSDMFELKQDLSITQAESDELKKRSVEEPSTLIGWQILLSSIPASSIPANRAQGSEGNAVNGETLNDGGEETNQIQPVVVISIKKNKRFKTVFRIVSGPNDTPRYTLLKRSETKVGHPFWPMRKVYSQDDTILEQEKENQLVENQLGGFDGPMKFSDPSSPTLSASRSESFD